MNTVLTYLDAPDAFDLEAVLAKCAPAADGTHVLHFDQTPFYPQGGGQPSDVGHIQFENGAALKVIEVRRLPGTVAHRGQLCGEVRPGMRAVLMVDPSVRALHSRLHTAGELVCAAVTALGIDHQVSSAIHFPSLARVTLSSLTRVGEERLSCELQTQIDALVSAKLPVSVRNPTCAERQRVSDVIVAGAIRTVAIGTVSCRPCLGTHVPNTGDLGAIGVRQSRRKGVTNLTYQLD